MNRPRQRAALRSVVRRSAATALFSLPSRRPARSAPAAPAPATSSPPRPPGQLIPLGSRQDKVRLPPARAAEGGQPGRTALGEPRAPPAHRLNGNPQHSSEIRIALAEAAHAVTIVYLGQGLDDS
jgi:hypothetical protein